MPKMKKLISSFLAEMKPLWLNQRRQNKGLGHSIERPEQLEQIIRANPWVPFQKRDPIVRAGRGPAGDAHTRH
jgi:hypothetical protein